MVSASILITLFATLSLSVAQCPYAAARGMSAGEMGAMPADHPGFHKREEDQPCKPSDIVCKVRHGILPMPVHVGPDGKQYKQKICGDSFCPDY